MKIKKQELTTEDILEHWRQGKSTLDWRLLNIKEKGEWLKACLFWSGIPNTKIKAFDYIVDGNQVNEYPDFYCLLGETFFGYRGYFGQDSHGFEDCFLEIFRLTRNKETVEKGAKVRFMNSEQIKESSENTFQYVIGTFKHYGFEVELV